MVKGQKLQDYVNELVGGRTLDRMKKPFAVVATNLANGERTVFVRGNTGQAVRASSSIPGVFEAVAIGKAHYVDGGVVSPVPVDAAVSYTYLDVYKRQPWISTSACSISSQHSNRVSGKPFHVHATSTSPTIAQITSSAQVRRSRAITPDTTSPSTTMPASSQRSKREGGIATIPAGTEAFIAAC